MIYTIKVSPTNPDLLFLKFYVLLFEEAFYHFVPCVFQAFIHGKGFKGSSGYAGEAFSVVVDVQIEALHPGRIEGRRALGDQPFDIFAGQAEYEAEA